MNFVEYVFKKTHNKEFNDRSMLLLTIQNLNYRAYCMRELLQKRGKELGISKNTIEKLLDLDTEMDDGYFERHHISPHKGGD